MKRVIASFAVCAIVAVSAFAYSMGIDVSGKWTLSADAQGQEVPITMVLKHVDEKVSGTVSTPFGDGTFTDGSVSEKTLKGKVNIAVQGEDMVLDFSGTIDGESISGSISGATIPEVSFTGKKEKEEKKGS